MPDSTMPPPKHGNGAFIAVAIVMLLGVGGLLLWKFAGKDESSAVPPPVVTSKSDPVLAEAPPPPPPEEEEEEQPAPKTEEKTPAKKTIVASGQGGCSGTCTGDAPAALQSGLRAAAGRSQGCYERALRTNTMLQGKMTVGVRVSATGTVCSANVVSDSLGDPGVVSCVLQKFRGGSFPKPNGGCVDVNVPISFQPKTNK